MQNFIVLGIIPGTDIQTNLNFWIVVNSIVLILALRTQLKTCVGYVLRTIAAYMIARTIDCFEFTNVA